MQDNKPTALSKDLLELVCDWTVNVPYSKPLVLRASTFQEWVDEMLPIAAALKPCLEKTPEPTHDQVKVGSWVLRRRTLPMVYRWQAGLLGWGKDRWEFSSLALPRNGREYGRVFFDGDIHIPVLSDRIGQPWMSLTPMEVLTNRPGVRKAKGDVLIGGLGLGMLARMVRAKKGIGRVVVVDNRQEVIDVFGNIEGVEVVRADFYEYALEHLAVFETILADIWQSHGDVRWDKKYKAIKASHPRVWGWGDYALQS